MADCSSSYPRSEPTRANCYGRDDEDHVRDHSCIYYWVRAVRRLAVVRAVMRGLAQVVASPLDTGSHESLMQEKVTMIQGVQIGYGGLDIGIVCSMSRTAAFFVRLKFGRTPLPLKIYRTAFIPNASKSPLPFYTISAPNAFTEYLDHANESAFIKLISRRRLDQIGNASHLEQLCTKKGNMTINVNTGIKLKEAVPTIGREVPRRA